MSSQVPTTCMQWPSHKAFRISVSNYGFGGSNSHAILERAPSLAAVEPKTAPTQQASQLFMVSAKSSTSLQCYVSALCDHIDKTVINNEQEYLASLSNTLCKRRTRFRHTHAIAASSLKDLAEKLRLPLPTSRIGDVGPLVFVFTGQGAQWARMGHSLMQDDNYNATMQEADRHLRDLGASWSLIGQLHLRVNHREPVLTYFCR